MLHCKFAEIRGLLHNVLQGWRSIASALCRDDCCADGVNQMVAHRRWRTSCRSYRSARQPCWLLGSAAAEKPARYAQPGFMRTRLCPVPALRQAHRPNNCFASQLPSACADVHQEGDGQQELIAARNEDLVQGQRQGSRLLDLSKELEARALCLSISLRLHCMPAADQFLTGSPIAGCHGCQKGRHHGGQLPTQRQESSHWVRTWNAHSACACALQQASMPSTWLAVQQMLRAQ